MKPLNIYLGDLTYTTISLASDSFPLNVGFVAAYCKEKFGKDVNIRLFKYIHELETAIKDNPPDILALSNYQWNFNLDLAFFHMVKNLSPKTITVMGGPNVSDTEKERRDFLLKNPLIDFYTMLEGEEAFSNIVEKVFEYRDNINILKQNSIGGVMHRIDNENIHVGSLLIRKRALDEIPSPYLTGMMDNFFDGKLTPMLQSNRGCPFTCTFCDEGHSNMTKVNYFSLDRVKAELDYISLKATHSRIDDLRFTDSNFAMYERDYEICEHIAKIQKNKNYPKVIQASTGKNRKERIIKAVELLNGTLDVRVSVQSMDRKVLKNIRRQNIKLDVMNDVAESSIALGLHTNTELILALPGETFESHIKSLSEALESGIGVIIAYNLMLLNGTEMASQADIDKYGLKHHYRVNAMDFGKLSDGTISVEIGKVVTSTKTMTFDEYLAARTYHLLIQIFYNSETFFPFFKLMRLINVPIIEFFNKIKSNLSEAPESFKKIFDSFVTDAEGELWSSYDDLLAHVNKEENYKKLCNGEIGHNLLQTYHAKATKDLGEWKDFIFKTFKETLGYDDMDRKENAIINEINDYCFNRAHNIWGDDRCQNNPLSEFNYNITEWMKAPLNEKLNKFKFSKPTKIEFQFTPQQNTDIVDYLKRYGNTPTGIGRIVSNLVGVDKILRNPVRAN